ncbi:hypothetical protein A8C56_12340 [Niabella ginsenosidivorans]|uniref:Uncharacterized protein n=1 Tax=Niabella ginsenosidivorans TaxID=1176587 RepID=A0A1A9I2V8_9BACT|nr:hypothetical protein [Niabella ginsenosidivorans]ANH81665.1 hypothetical protein A8C56_12340 [Niabella ginsenosidivorans]
MLSEKEVALLYETIMSAPGMNDAVKLDLRIPRKNVLLLVKVLEKGLQTKTGDALEGLMRAAGESSQESMQQIGTELLEKAGLSDMHTRLSTLHPK